MTAALRLAAFIAASKAGGGVENITWAWAPKGASILLSRSDIEALLAELAAVTAERDELDGLLIKATTELAQIDELLLGDVAL